jgi:hypothetical protein
MNKMQILEKMRFFAPSLVNKILYIANNIIIKDDIFIGVYWKLVREGKILLSIREAYNIYFHLTNSIALGYSIAELGVYKGGSSKLICEFKSDLPLHLFDTFEGMPDVNSDVDIFRKGDLSDTSEDRVKRYLENYNNVSLHKGIFPNTVKNLPDDIEFCFVHLDVDIYESTLSGLNYFYPRLKNGGVIVSHDYNQIYCPGVKKAFDEYFKDKRQDVICLWDTQCMVKKNI